MSPALSRALADGVLAIHAAFVASVNAANNRKKCKVSEGTHSSNASVNRWFDPDGGNSPTLQELLAKAHGDKVQGCRRIAYQIPHADGDACGRSFEDAFILANPNKFGIAGPAAADRETQAWDIATDVKKSEFALQYAINDTEWSIPRYIEQGLRWLGQVDHAAAAPAAIEPQVEVNPNA